MSRHVLLIACMLAASRGALAQSEQPLEESGPTPSEATAQPGVSDGTLERPPRVRCAFPLYVHPTLLFGDATGPREHVQPGNFLFRVATGYRHTYCRERRRGLDVRVGGVLESGNPGEYFGGGLELQVAMPLGARTEDTTLGPRVSVVLLENSFVGFWVGARLETGPVVFGIDVLRVPPRHNTNHTNRESTGIYGVAGIRGKPGAIATGIGGGLFVLVALAGIFAYAQGH